MRRNSTSFMAALAVLAMACAIAANSWLLSNLERTNAVRLNLLTHEVSNLAIESNDLRKAIATREADDASLSASISKDFANIDAKLHHDIVELRTRIDLALTARYGRWLLEHNAAGVP